MQVGPIESYTVHIVRTVRLKYAKSEAVNEAIKNQKWPSQKSKMAIEVILQSLIPC
jgi:hypothetical protein